MASTGNPSLDPSTSPPNSPQSVVILPSPQTSRSASTHTGNLDISDKLEDISTDYWALPPLSEGKPSQVDSLSTDFSEADLNSSGKETRGSSVGNLINSMSLSKKRLDSPAQPTKSTKPAKPESKSAKPESKPIKTESKSAKAESKSTKPESKSTKAENKSSRKESKSAKTEIKSSKGESSKPPRHEGSSNALTDFLNGGAAWRLPDQKMLNTALLDACKAGSTKAITSLIEKGANINATNDEGKSALMEAVFWGHETTARHLLQNGANVHYRGGLRMTPIPGVLITASALGLAVSKRNLPVLNAILEAGADPNAQTYPLTVLQESALMGKPAIAEMLLKRKAKINSYSPEYGTALMLALHHGKQDVVRLLVEQGARVKHALEKDTKDGVRTPMQAAISAEIPAQVELLMESVVVTNSKEAKELVKWAKTRYKKSPNARNKEQLKIIALLGELVDQLEADEG